ncbi:MAG TPA: sulfatase-like hydrolase/transferase, partial [Bacteroidales bacterium]|nr:sulfatase-like hydrolase/transferase [Bacteroidales bacterium]
MKTGLSAIICASSALISCSSAHKHEPLPNIVYILADDLGYGDLSCYGQQKISTPNIDRLAREGMLFTQHYTGCTVSAPSRSSLMTGLHT